MNLPVQVVLPALPLEFKARVKQIPGSDIVLTVPFDQVLAQLSLGAIKVNFGQLRAAAPGVFSDESDRDHIPVALPLNEILARINPRLLVRRANQKKVDVPDDITSPFDNRGRGLVFGGAKPAASAPDAEAKPASAREMPLPGHGTELLKAKSGPRPAGRATPSAATEASIANPIPFRPAFRSLAKNQPNSHSNPVSPVPISTAVSPVAPPTRLAVPVSQGAGAFALPAASREPIDFAHQVPPPTEAAGEIVLTVALAALSESWPEMLRQEIAQLNLGNAQLALPGSAIVPAMQRGKAVFSWKMLRSWIRPAPLPAVSAHDNVMLELPLKVLVPLFVQHNQHILRPRRQMVIDESIPNLFFGFPQPSSRPAEATNGKSTEHLRTPAATPPTAGLTLPEPVPAAPAENAGVPIPAAGDSNYYVWDDVADTARVDETEFRRPTVQTDFLSRYATPNDVVARAISLDGVAGALVALPDGLMVASKLPADVNGDTLAAFVPQIYGKVSQCTRELRMGPLNNLKFTVGNVPWKVFRVNAIFFAAFGRAGQPLPSGQLAALAALLDRKK